MVTEAPSTVRARYLRERRSRGVAMIAPVEVGAFINDHQTPYEIFRQARPDLVYCTNGAPAGCYGAIVVARKLDIPFVISEGLITEQFLGGTDAERAALKRHYLAARASGPRRPYHQPRKSRFFARPPGSASGSWAGDTEQRRRPVFLSLPTRRCVRRGAASSAFPTPIFFVSRQPA
jgi:hypothetical protein